MPFANPKRTCIRIAEVGWIEPIAVIFSLCFVRSRQENRCRCTKFNAALQRTDPSLTQASEWTGTRTHKLRVIPDIRLIISDAVKQRIATRRLRDMSRFR